MKHIIAQVLKSLLILAFMAIGFVFVGAFVEYKTMNGANIYAGLTFAAILCTVIALGAYLTIKEVLNNQTI